MYPMIRPMVKVIQFLAVNSTIHQRLDLKHIVDKYGHTRDSNDLQETRNIDGDLVSEPLADRLERRASKERAGTGIDQYAEPWGNDPALSPRRVCFCIEVDRG